MGHIFISYSRRDTETVDRFARELNRGGLEIWLDRQDIKAGDSWRMEIVRAIDTCAALVLVLSRHSAASDNVRKEIDLAQDSGRKIFVLLLEKIKIPDELRYQLAGLQFADVPEYGFDTSSQGLVHALNKYITTENPLPPPTRREVEMEIKGFKLSTFNQSRQNDLIDFVSNLSKTEKSEMQIVNMATGDGLHVFMDVPATTAFSLKTMALNQDKRFKEKNITALRLKGDRRFIKVSAGIITLAGIIALLRTRVSMVWLSGCSCFTCLAVVGVLAWQGANIFKQTATEANTPFSTRVPQATLPDVPNTDIPIEEIPVTGPTKPVPSDAAECFINVPNTFAYEGPSRGYYVSSYERYEQGDPFIVLMSDRSGEWLYGILPDQTKGWLRIDWLTGRCWSPAIPTASFIPQPPPTMFPTRNPASIH
jgi:hypothetical protein